MMNYKAPTFQERIALAAEARQKALDKLRAKPPVDEAVLAERRAAKAAKEAAAIAAREAKRAEAERIKAEKQAAIEAAEAAAAAEAAEKAAAEAAAAAALIMSDEEKKAIRDAKYAARKQRKGR
jgi:Family of unknown function (DUF6481)